MNDWIYVGAVAFGAFSLLIEADRNYRTSLGNHPFPYHAILAKVELENLCTPREWMSGFLFYSLLYLLTYAVILSSTELFLLVRNANLAELQVGANTTFVGPLSDPMELADSTYGKPIFVSAFLIAFLSMGAMRPVETYMRALAHRLAGVPRGVYKVLERLQIVDYLKLNKGFPTPLLNRFESKLRDFDLSDITDQYTSDLRTQLSAIDCLSPSVTAGFSRLHFPMTHFDAFKDVPEQLTTEVEAVENAIEELEPTEASLKSLHEKAVLTANSSKAVFAVFYVRNNHAIKNTDPKSPIATIEKLIARGYRIELNAFAMSIFVSAILSMLACFFAYKYWNVAKVNGKPTYAVTEILNVWNKAAPEATVDLLGDVPAFIADAKGIQASMGLPDGFRALVALPAGTPVLAPAASGDEIETEFNLTEAIQARVVRLNGKRATILLPKAMADVAQGSEVNVTLPDDTKVTVVLPETATTPATLPQRTRTTAQLIEPIGASVALPPGTRTRVALPDAQASGSQDKTSTFVWQAGAEIRVELPDGTQATATLFNDVKAPIPPPAEGSTTPNPSQGDTLAVELPADTRARLQLPVGTRMMVTLEKNTDADVELKKDTTAIVVQLDASTATIVLPDKTLVNVNLPQEISATVDQLRADKATLALTPTWDNCQAQIDRISDTPQTVQQSTRPPNACQIAMESGNANWITGQRARFLTWAFWDTLQRCLMVFTIVVATVFFREVRVDQNSWKPWSIKRIPFLRLLGMSFTPALMGVFALSAGYVIQLYWDSGLEVTQRQVTNLFQNNWVYFAWHFPPGMFLSISALLLMDKHDDWAFWASMLAGLIAAVFLWLFPWVIFQTTGFNPGAQGLPLPTPLGTLPYGLGWRDAISTGTLPAMFIVWFALFLEVTEQGEESEWLHINPRIRKKLKKGATNA